MSRSYHDWYQSNLVSDSLLIRTLPISRNILNQAALIRARVPSIKTPDAIHVATARMGACTHFVTGDVELRRKLERDEAWMSSDARFAFIDLSIDALLALKRKLSP